MVLTGKPLIGVLLLNLGGPDSLEAVRPFLYNLFSDREIIRLGPLLFMQKPFAWLISTIRASKSRQMYSFIGGKSPINEITMAQAEALERVLNDSRLTVNGSRLFKVYIGMRYWHPFIKDALEKIISDGIKHIIVLSLFPHYSKTTTGSAILAFKRTMERFTVHGSRFTVKYIEQWYDFPPYIDALAEGIYNRVSEFNLPSPSFSKGGYEGVTLLYSAHSLPLSIVRQGDPYPAHIRSTVELVNNRLSEKPYNIKDLRWYLSFQSKMGRRDWLEPSTEETIIKLSKEGIRDILIIPVSFVSDNIETLYEIGIYYRDIAIKHGVNLRRCPSLNTSERFITALKELITKAIGEGR